MEKVNIVYSLSFSAFSCERRHCDMLLLFCAVAYLLVHSQEVARQLMQQNILLVYYPLFLIVVALSYSIIIVHRSSIAQVFLG